MATPSSRRDNKSRRWRTAALDAVEQPRETTSPSTPSSRRTRRRVEGVLAHSRLDRTTRRSQREASPFTQFALTGCALLLVGLGLLQIFGTMVTVKARDETKKKQ